MNDPDSARDAVERLTDAIFDSDVVAVKAAITAGADVSALLIRFPETPLELATRWHANPEVVEALLSAGAAVPPEALESLGEDDVTDWMIESEEDEQRFSRVAELLLLRGADPNVCARNGEPLIMHFSADRYPRIHRVLAHALQKSSNRNA